MQNRRRFNPCAARPWALTVALLLGVAALAAQSARDRADELYRKRDFRAAAEALLAHLDREPGDYDALLLLGLSLEQMGDPVQAEKAFDEAARRRPEDAQARLFLARSLYRQRRLDDAAAALEQARAHGAEAARADHLDGLIWEERGDVDKALALYRRAGDFSDALVRAAACLVELRRPHEALSLLESAPESEAVAYQRALAYVALDEPKQAARALRLSREPRSVALRERLERLPASVPPKGVEAASTPIPVRFLEQGEASGVNFVLHNHPTPQKHLPETMAGGLAVFDADGDGLPDLFFTNGAETPSLRKAGARYANRLYRNLGGFRFEDATEKAGLEGEGFSIGAAAADYDTDGDVDLFVAGVNRNLLYRNRGDGTFEEVSNAAGIASGPWAVGGAWLDYDNDGLLDLFVANYLDWDPATAPLCEDAAAKVRTYCHPKFFGPLANVLYRNRGDGTFDDVSAASGIARSRGKAMSAAVADVDLDGDLDIFTPNDVVPNLLFVNQGDGRFREDALAAGVALRDDGRAVSAMGSSFSDLDGDGRPDLLFTALPGETFPYFHNEGGGLFLDRTDASGVAALSRRHGGWGVALADFNNDGLLDVMTANAHVMDNAEAFSDEVYEQPNALWLNRGGAGFEDASEAAGLDAQPGAHRGLVVADLDQDGRQDAVVTVLGGRPELWRNVTSDPGCALSLRLRGRRSNRDAIGARVAVDGRSWQVASTAGYASSVHGPLHIGLGACDVARRAEIVWPSGARSQVEIPPYTDALNVEEPAASP
ncbi:MAG: FG-GAP-like repeat-containing protein [Bryobacterales bacterium]